MNRWFAAILLAGACIAGGATTIAAKAQPVPTVSPMVSPMTSASPSPMNTMRP